LAGTDNFKVSAISAAGTPDCSQQKATILGINTSMSFLPIVIYFA